MRRILQFEGLDQRISPAVITYPLASSIIIFDPKGDREPDPGDINAPPQLDFILEPPLNIMKTDEITPVTQNIA